jgi:hypothetical protein
MRASFAPLKIRIQDLAHCGYTVEVVSKARNMRKKFTDHVASKPGIFTRQNIFLLARNSDGKKYSIKHKYLYMYVLDTYYVFFSTNFNLGRSHVTMHCHI